MRFKIEVKPASDTYIRGDAEGLGEIHKHHVEYIHMRQPREGGNANTRRQDGSSGRRSWRDLMRLFGVDTWPPRSHQPTVRGKAKGGGETDGKHTQQQQIP